MLKTTKIYSFFTGLCELKKLEELDLSWNSFEGILPSCLYNLTSLQLLDLSRNEFRGNISSLIAGLTSLKYIDLSFSARLFPRFELKKGFLKKARPKIAFG